MQFFSKFLPLILQIFATFTQKSANFDNFSQKNFNLDNFFQKSAILDNFPLLKVKNMGKFLNDSFNGWKKKEFFGRMFTAELHIFGRIFTADVAKMNPISPQLG